LIKTRAVKLIAKELSLRDLRKAMSRTQVDAAKIARDIASSRN
jgi:hypothetical protein